jgi:Uma2 family endonuclease
VHPERQHDRPARPGLPRPDPGPSRQRARDRGSPTLVVEILSPSTTNIDRSTKHQLYRRFEIPYYWIVDPEARIVEAYGLAEGTYQLLERASGAAAVALPPFPDLAIVPVSLRP